ncbi:MAG: ATPase, T2SS/T4P/T4SS family [Maritimibacter sp.]
MGRGYCASEGQPRGDHTVWSRATPSKTPPNRAKCAKEQLTPSLRLANVYAWRRIRDFGLKPDLRRRAEPALGRPGRPSSHPIAAKCETPGSGPLPAQSRPATLAFQSLEISPGRDELGVSFARALRSFLRHDPNVIMVGEIRLIDLGVEPFIVKSVLRGVLGQRLEVGPQGLRLRTEMVG